jgi:hypothetical protein
MLREGDTLETYGSGNFAFGYFGGLMDAATGLLYVGDGQYYDPSTGRFLTRNANPNSPNPYVPWDPTGAIIGPLGMLALFLGKRKKKSKYDILLFVLAFAVVTGVALSACGGGGGDGSDGGNGNPPTSPPPSDTPSPTDTPPPTPTQPPPAPTNTPDPECLYPQPGSTPVPNDENHLSYGKGGRFYRIFDETPGGWWDRYRDPVAGLYPILITMAFYWETRSLRHNHLFMAAMQESFSRKLWGSYNDYGKDGWAYYLGGREPIRRSIAVLEVYKGNRMALEEILRTTYNTSASDIETVYNAYGASIWSNCDWRSGRNDNRPWEFGNPTEKSPQKLLKELEGKIPSCNGHCTDPKSIYFRDTRLNKEDYYINEEGLKVYRLAFVITPAQGRHFCNNANCVKP